MAGVAATSAKEQSDGAGRGRHTPADPNGVEAVLDNDPAMTTLGELDDDGGEVAGQASWARLG
jgi:hypothetical protein